jgi:fibronectin type 3 domain-containing protein
MRASRASSSGSAGRPGRHGAARAQPATFRPVRPRALLAAVAVAALLLNLSSAATSGNPQAASAHVGAVTATPANAVAAATAADPVLAVGGDIACTPGTAPSATHCQQGATGDAVAGINPDYVLPLGDSQYDNGTDAEYAGSYSKTVWGTDKGISRPAAGNHEYRTAGATPYYTYFGANAGDPAKGYYSWNITGPNNSFTWHMIALNSECAQLGGGSISQGCGVGSSQETWLKADLAANKNVCTIAYWHRPRFSSSTTTPSSTTYVAFWNDLYAAGADIVLNGHAHDYERFNPQTSSGAADGAKGLREFVVGTGGKDFHTMGAPIANSASVNTSAFGILKLTLHAGSYDWQFVAANGYSFNDSGSASCHSAPLADTTPPTAPTGLTASAVNANQVNLSWNASTDNVGVKNYNVYRGSNGATPTLLATTTTNATSYTDTTVSGSTPYTYQVQAIDAAGNLSQLSTVASVTTPATPDTAPPTAPTNLQAELIASNEIDLGWTGSTDSGTGVSGYKVYRKGPGESTFTLLATTAGTGAGHNSYQDLTVKPSSAYQYYVTAYDGANNESGPSNTVSATTPSGPSSRTFTFAAAGDATIDQANPTRNAGASSTLIADNSPVDDFLLKFTVATSSCISLTSATLRLTNNADGSTKGGDFYTTGPNWSESTVNWSNAPTRGALLNSLGAVASNAVASVDVTKGVTTLNGEVDFRVGSPVSDGVRYWSKEATTTGNRPQLTVVCATSAPAPDTMAPTAPGNLTAKAVGSGEIDLQWTDSTDNVGVTGYNIYRGGSRVGAVSGDALAYQDTSVQPSTSYTYTVTAVDAAGNESAASNSMSATTPATTGPAVPTNLTGTAVSSSEVDLSWTPSTSSTVTGYNIYRGPHGGALAKISSTTASPFQDTTVAAGTTYDYAVTAVDTGGVESAKSNTVTVTTPGGTGEKTFSFSSAGDATIDATNPGTNAGADTKLVVDNSPVDDFVIKFAVTTTGCTTVRSATLQLTDNANGSVKGGDFYTTGTDWSESTVTYGNAPARGTLLGSLGAVSSGGTYTVDVTAGVSTLNGEVAFRVGSTSGDGAHYYSKEGGTTAQKPKLSVVCS